MKLHRCAAPAFAGILTILCADAHAEPVRVTRGSLAGGETTVTLDAAGERGLILSAAGDSLGGVYGPSLDCSAGGISSCLPGDIINIEGRWSGGDFLGNVSLDGNTFSVGQGGPSEGSLSAEFAGVLTLPAFTGMTFTSASAPFTFTGLLVYPPSFGIPQPQALIGQGLATLEFEWGADTPIQTAKWVFRGASYDFSPVPEPASASLLATGLAGLLLRRHRRRRIS